MSPRFRRTSDCPDQREPRAKARLAVAGGGGATASDPADRGRRGIVDGLRAGHRRPGDKGCRSKRHDSLRRAQVRMRPVCGSGQAEAAALATVRRPTPYLRSSARPDSPDTGTPAYRRVELSLRRWRHRCSSSRAQHPFTTSNPRDQMSPTPAPRLRQGGHHRSATAVTSGRQSHVALMRARPTTDADPGRVSCQRVSVGCGSAW